jgi:ATP/maltotriose-dependent transcriptional regulator MalT
MRGEWPLVGRTEELALIASLRSGRRGGVVISGAAGVGKTRLASDATTAATDEGAVAVRLRATPGMATLALSGFAPLLAGRAPTADRVDAVVSELLERAAGRVLVVTIDDAHLLDEQSAGVLHQLVVEHRAFAILTTRSRTPQPVAITALWKDEDAVRIELQPLSSDETEELADALLGGTVEPATARRLWAATQGNPLFVRELVLAGLESGQLAEQGGAWRWNGVVPVNGRLREVIDERLVRLDDDARATLEIVALADTVSVDTLARLAVIESAAALERAGLVAISGSADDEVVGIAHPLYGEVLRAGIPKLRARGVFRQLADAAEASSVRSPVDAARIAVWRMEHGATLDTTALLEASDVARWSVRTMLVEHLQDVLRSGDDQQSSPSEPEAPPPWRSGDDDTGLRLARRAWEADRTVRTGVKLANMLVWHDRMSEAADVLAATEAVVTDEEDRMRVANVHASVLFWAFGRVDEAQDVLVRAEAVGAENRSLDPVRDRLARTRAGVLVNAGRPDGALAVARSVLEREDDDADVHAASTGAAALSLLGRTADAIELVDRFLPRAMADAESSGLVMGELVFARTAALLRAGRLGEARALGQAAYGIALDSGLAEGTAAFAILVGLADLLSGRVRSAARRCREADALLADRDPFSYRRWALAGLAHASALAGDRNTASAALATADSLAIGRRFYDTGLELARSALLLLDGDSPAAARIARQAAAAAAETGLAPDEAFALHAATMVRPDDRASAHAAAARLAELRASTDSLLVAAMAATSAAVATRDAVALEAAGTDFERIGANLLAADAVATAALLHERAAQARAARSSAQRARDLLERCEGASLAVFERLSAPAGLTSRELEIARLAAQGLASREIADRLVVSVRTVDSHLYRVYSKLGVTTRAGLTNALQAETSGSGASLSNQY